MDALGRAAIHHRVADAQHALPRPVVPARSRVAVGFDLCAFELKVRQIGIFRHGQLLFAIPKASAAMLAWNGLGLKFGTGRPGW